MVWQQVKKDPFKLFFPIGIFLFIFGIFPWTLLISETIGVYPIILHREIMINGFLLSFIVGFLMTAIPRFTQSFYAYTSEIVVATLALIFSAIFSFLGMSSWHYLSASTALITLVFYGGRRFLNRRQNPPPAFIFVGVGIVLLFLSNIYFLLTRLGLFEGDMVKEWQGVYNHGAVSCLILGVGSRVIPALLGWQSLPVNHDFSEKFPWFYFALCMTFVSSFFLPFGEIVNPLLRAFIVIYFAFSYWKIHRLPINRSPFGWSLWTSTWLILLGYVGSVFAGTNLVHILHILFVGGFSLLTLLIGMHVFMAHCENPRVAKGKTSKLLYAMTGLLILAMLTRVTSVIWPQAYLSHLAYAAMTLLLGLLAWLLVILRSSLLPD